jgi:hypothetical protein
MIHFSFLKIEVTIPSKVEDVYRLLWNLLPPTLVIYSDAIWNTYLQNDGKFIRKYTISYRRNRMSSYLRS